MIPGTQHLELRVDRYYCRFHNRFTEPIFVLTDGNLDAQTPACEECYMHDIGGIKELKFAAAADSSATTAECELAECPNPTAGFCLQCKKRFCTRHLDHDKLLCVECLGLSGEVEADEEDEFDILEADTSGTDWRRRVH